MTDTESRARRFFRGLSPVRGMAGRVFLSTAAIVCAVLFAALLIASYSARRATREAERRGLEQAADLTAQLLAGRGRSLAGGVRVFVQAPLFRALVARGQHDDILDQTLEAATQLSADWVFITDEQGTLLAKSDEPGVQGVGMSGIPLVAGALQGRATFGFGISRDSLLFQTVAVPIAIPRAAPVGVLVATKLVDRQMALDVRAATGTDIVFYTLDGHGKAHVAATSLDSMSQAAAALPASPNDTAASAALRSSGTAHTTRIGATTYATQGATLTTSGGEVVGGFIVARPASESSAQLAGIRRSLIAAAALGFLLALVAAWSSARSVTRPARALAAAATRALEGEYDEAARAAAEATAGSPSSEVAALGTALTAFLQELREKQALTALVARPTPIEAAPNGDASLVEDERPRGGRIRASGARLRTPLAPQLTARAGTLTLPSGVLAPGHVVAERYEIRDVIGVGGTGIVYRALDRTLDDVVALKMLRPELVADDPRAREELKQELRLTRRVSHRNIVRTHDFGVSHSGSHLTPYLTMELVEGTSLASVLAKRGALPAAVVLALGRQLMRGLEAAHEQGIMHGDIKPANILLATDGLVKITGFGVASLVRRPASPLATRRPDDAGHPPRLAGAVVGTPEYMAPELLLGGQPDVRTDLYAAGMVLHECLTGATPFQGDTPRGFLAQKLDTPPEMLVPAARGGGEARTLANVIALMTAADASDRPGTAAEVSALLAALA